MKENNLKPKKEFENKILHKNWYKKIAFQIGTNSRPLISKRKSLNVVFLIKILLKVTFALCLHATRSFSTTKKKFCFYRKSKNERAVTVNDVLFDWKPRVHEKTACLQIIARNSSPGFIQLFIPLFPRDEFEI